MHRDASAPRRPLLYVAAPLFSMAELSFNISLRLSLNEHVDVFLPQEDGDLVVTLIAEGMSALAARDHVFHTDLLAIQRCDILLLVLDGRSVDEGAAFELGYAFALGKQCIGLQTDPRRLLPSGNNPMIERPLERCFDSVGALVDWIASTATQALSQDMSSEFTIRRSR